MSVAVQMVMVMAALACYILVWPLRWHSVRNLAMPKEKPKGWQTGMH
jgi:hypothetical protein